MSAWVIAWAVLTGVNLILGVIELVYRRRFHRDVETVRAIKRGEMP